MLLCCSKLNHNEGVDESWNNSGARAVCRVCRLQYWAMTLLVFPVVTLFGNMLVCLSVFIERTLHTITNYFIVSLAVADIMVAILVMPLAVYVEVHTPSPLSPSIIPSLSLKLLQAQNLPFPTSDYWYLPYWPPRSLNRLSDFQHHQLLFLVFVDLVCGVIYYEAGYLSVKESRHRFIFMFAYHEPIPANMLPLIDQSSVT